MTWLSDKIGVAFCAAIVQKPPTVLRHAYPLQIDVCDQNLLFRRGSTRHNFAEGIGHEGSAPELKLSFSSNAIDRSYENAIKRSMGAHCRFPTAGGKRLLSPQLFEPAYCSRIKDDLSSLNRMDP